MHAVAKGSAWLGAAVGALRDSVLVTVGYARFTNPVPFVEVDVAPFPSGNWCALDTAGAAYCYGTNLSGELGGGAAATGPGPVAVVGGHVFRRIGVNQNDACALDTQNVMHCWGANLNAELGLGTRSPSKVSEPTAAGGALRFRDIAIGLHRANCGINAADSVLYCWGHDDEYQVSRAPNVATDSLVAPVSGSLKALHADLEAFAGCAVGIDHAVSCWGLFYFGGLPPSNSRTATASR